MAKILYVDADHERTRVIVELLCEKGHYVIVTRSAAKKNLGEELLGQLLGQPVALALTGGFPSASGSQ